MQLLSILFCFLFKSIIGRGAPDSAFCYEAGYRIVVKYPAGLPDILEKKSYMPDLI
jgi:hypothetical protein